MRSTGIVRRVDNLGRIVLPKEIRDSLDIDIKDPLAIYVEDQMIILTKYEPACVFCGQAREVFHYKGKNICRSCMDELKRI